MFELTIIVDFEAAHHIPDYPGKCCRLHGHNWKVEVSVKGNQLNTLGMLIDFKELKAEVQAIIGKLDHFYLNEIEPFCRISPTAENIAKYIYDELANHAGLAETVTVASVKVWESAHSAVSYSGEEQQ
ncbi:6-carboxytetrahydropterin synthase QueD [Propionispora vibrioides]|jgi:6-pyruvoyltetrahydropterin/6-carboxytetrahydropterin synthase|uniref:6-carboxy-5,6,7,8-tetrahydropterin synthase n=1 Tax=Propionispora vibrioides TaxID=112903 RepID=A0A1H8NK87_9FIRM|nr:6-carboxytetrahydropterin synthase QueD [Propionispora vibrioides]SEO29982.1 6-pyruvoyltetrahydropterin/6-carboxytetrahydropterin synthase [Propionispora vibrioides]